MKIKNIIAMIAVLTLAFAFTGCNATSTNTSSASAKSKSSTISSIVSSEKNTSISSQVESKAKAPKSISLGQKVLVTTDCGKFNVTFDKLKRDPDDNTTALLDCTINNINFKDSNSVFYLENYMNVTDDKNFIVKTAGMSSDDGNYLSWVEVPKGTNARIVVPYNIQKTTTALTFKINKQYILKANIE